MTPAYRLTDPGFAYANAASHSDPAAFRERMAQRARQAEREARERERRSQMSAVRFMREVDE